LLVEYSTVPETIEETVEATVISALEAPFTLDSAKEQKSTEQPLGTLTDQELKKEMIRQTMSELKKRSAATRVKRKIQI